MGETGAFFLDPVLLAIPFFGITMLLEHLILRKHGKPAYVLRDSAGNIGMGLGFLVIDAAFKVGLIAWFQWLYSHRLFDLPHTVWVYALLVIAEDFALYASHRAGHEIRILWCGHHNHHSSPGYNLSTALRQSWTELLPSPIFWGFLPLLGFPVEWILIQMSVNLLYQYLMHTRYFKDFGPLGWVLNTPAFHRVHHGKNPIFLDRNYAGIFIIWDRLFGTFQAETEEPDYGVSTPVGSDNPLKIAFHEHKRLWRELRETPGWWDRLGLIVRAPGWRPDGSGETAAVLRARALAKRTG
jgi:sterol desaturase/sphingolipid hydroxylase (fatty acid hydroxylase superfamily)